MATEKKNRPSFNPFLYRQETEIHRIKEIDLEHHGVPEKSAARQWDVSVSPPHTHTHARGP